MIDFDLRNPDHVRDPYPVFARLRQDDPVHHSESLGGWMLTRDADVGHVLRSDVFSADTIRPFVEARAAHDPDVARLGRLPPPVGRLQRPSRSRAPAHRIESGVHESPGPPVA